MPSLKKRFFVGFFQEAVPIRPLEEEFCSLLLHGMIAFAAFHYQMGFPNGAVGYVMVLGLRTDVGVSEKSWTGGILHLGWLITSYF